MCNMRSIGSTHIYEEWKYVAYEEKEKENKNEFTVNNRCQFNVVRR